LTKKPTKVLRISALAFYFFDLTSLEAKTDLVGFLVEMTTPKEHFEINRPLVVKCPT
jgi:hypothetical protein